MKHGMSDTRLYKVWSGMKSRCYNPNDPIYKDYGARGITVCEEWKNDFLAFYTWAMETGYDETAPRGRFTIERNNNDGPYSPDNCRWATIAEQERNKRNNIKVQVDGETMVLKQACRKQGLVYTNELKTYRRRERGIRPMSEYNNERKGQAEAKAQKLRDMIEQNPSWTNAQLSEAMGLSVRQIQRLKKQV